jgi:murein DD-endopeptidase MepM/ murein hydrolase activator NlpD
MGRKIALVGAVSFAVILSAWVFFSSRGTTPPPEQASIASREIVPVLRNIADTDVVEEGARPEVVVPLDRAAERVTKKPFGILIDPATSPVRPERFAGYHTGTDFETFPDEVDADVAVRAICGGEVVAKRSASGYGGVFVTRCVIGGEDVTVVYGHLALSNIDAEIGERVEAGSRIGFLGSQGGRDTDGERKHLHLGIHRGRATDIRGYVSDRALLSEWIDPCLHVCGDTVR